jgi:O-antigen/teichoic acid export membrane protein
LPDGSREREVQPPPLPLISYDHRAVGSFVPTQSLPPASTGNSPGALVGGGVVEWSSIARLGLGFGLTLYLARALGPSAYGIFALAISIATILAYPLVVGLGRGLARSLYGRSTITADGRGVISAAIRIALPVAVVCGLALFFAAGPISDGYGLAGLRWPLRWAALGILGEATITIAMVGWREVPARVRAARLLGLTQTALEVAFTVVLVATGSGIAGASAGRAIAYSSAALGLLLLAGGIPKDSSEIAPVRRSMRGIERILVHDAGGTAAVALPWGAAAALQVILLGAMVGLPAVGSFGVDACLLIPVMFAGVAAGSSVARLHAVDEPQVAQREFERTWRWLVLGGGLVLAPLVVWAAPISQALFGSGYPSSAGVLRALAISAALCGPTALVATAAGHLAHGRNRWGLTAVVLAGCAEISYLLIDWAGVIGAAIAVDAIQSAWLCAFLWVGSRRLGFDHRALLLTTMWALAAAAAMAAVLLAAGTEHLSVLGGAAGLIGGSAAFVAVLLGAGEISLAALPSSIGAVVLRRRDH